MELGGASYPLHSLLFMFIFLVLYPAQAFLAAWLANRKGYDFLLGFLVGAFVPILALLAVAVAPPKRREAS